MGRKLIYRTIQRYKETGSLKDRARSGRSRNVRTRELKAKIKKRIVRNPRRSMRKMSRNFGISSRSIGRVVHDDLGLKSLKRRKVHMLTKAIREKRLQRSRGLLSRAGPDVVDRILFPMRSCSRFRRFPTLRMIVSFQAASKTSRSTFDSYQEGKSQLQSWYGAESQQTPGQILFLSRLG